jgi:cobyrinic acid a,c-diamide synthase
MIEFAVLRREAHFDVAQALALGELGESHGEKLIPTRERPHTLVAAIARHAAIEFVVRKKADELRKHGSTLVQGLSPSQLIAKE